MGHFPGVSRGYGQRPECTFGMCAKVAEGGGNATVRTAEMPLKSQTFSGFCWVCNALRGLQVLIATPENPLERSREDKIAALHTRA